MELQEGMSRILICNPAQFLSKRMKPCQQRQATLTERSEGARYCLSLFRLLEQNTTAWVTNKQGNVFLTVLEDGRLGAKSEFW